MARDDQDIRQARMRVLQPISATLSERGVSQTWLAERLGTDRYSVSKWLHGVHRVPDGFIGQACKALNIPVSLIVIPEPRDRYIQTPKPTKTPTKTPKPQPKGGRKNGQPTNADSAPAVRQSVQRVNRVRRAGRATPAAPRASH